MSIVVMIVAMRMAVGMVGMAMGRMAVGGGAMARHLADPAGKAHRLDPAAAAMSTGPAVDPAVTARMMGFPSGKPTEESP